MDIGALNELFAIPGHLHFETGEGGLTKAVVANSFATAEVYFQGAHVTSYRPAGQGELLWMSKTAQFGDNKAIRGGVPLCWPWFGKQEGHAQHGFARKSLFTLFGTSVNAQGETVLQFGLQDSEATRAVWPHAFMLEYRVSVGRTLGMELKTTNAGDVTFELSQALHTYFAVDAIENVRIEGFEGNTYIDTLRDDAACIQKGPVVIGEEVDRIYEDDGQSVTLSDGTHRVAIAGSGSRSSVVWNPWIAKAASMADFDDEGYKTMVCIETANARKDARILQPGESHTLVQQLIPAAP